MKKSILKGKLHQAIIKSSLYEQTCDVLVSELKEMSEALDRRRQLYKSMEKLVNRRQPKSMEEMANDLLTVLANEEGNTRPEWKDLEDEYILKLYDKLLKIIG